ncbi:hypothetical protein XENTR_v10008742 [Xenopus tropicalis]|nr:hypothetical protein XENTR_v10008742 [Xenopus tropicalis]
MAGDFLEFSSYEKVAATSSCSLNYMPVCLYCYLSFRVEDLMIQMAAVTRDTSCKPVPAKVGITAEYGHERQKTNCSAIIAMTKCSGECEHVLSYDKKEDKVVNMCKCCKATHTETRDADLACENGMTKTYKYKHITTCKCIPCTSYNDKI